MTSLKQIQQEIQTLPQEGLDLLAEFIQILKKTTFLSVQPTKELQKDDCLPFREGTVYEQFKASGLIGCVSVEEDLSTTYKQVLAKEWECKYDHR